MGRRFIELLSGQLSMALAGCGPGILHIVALMTGKMPIPRLSYPQSHFPNDK